MKTDLKKAKYLLESGEYTCVLCKDGEVYTSTERGVKPLLNWLDAGTDLKDFCAADRVVGKAAAFLYMIFGVKAVYAHVMSEGAVAILSKYKIQPSYDITVKEIRNRANTGICPMEETVKDIYCPQDAVIAIKNRLAELRPVK